MPTGETYCLFQTHRGIFYMCKQVVGYDLPSLIAVVKTCGLFFQSCSCISESLLASTGVHSHKRCTECREHLICPHRLSQRCWMTGTPLGTLPTQTCSCSPAPAAAFALCRPLLCLQSVRGKEGTQIQPPSYVDTKY